MHLNISSLPRGQNAIASFVVGTLTEKDDIGGDTEYWRGRLVDPTGSILIYAGQYQPEAAQILANMEAPAFVAVVGKPNLYQTEDGNIIISLRAESIQRVDEATRNLWIMDTARQNHGATGGPEECEACPCIQRICHRGQGAVFHASHRMQKELWSITIPISSITGR